MSALNIPESNLKRVVVIGGGFGGLKTLNQISSKYYQVVLIDKNNYHNFQPLLYQVATSGLEPDSIAYPLRKILWKKSEFYFRNTKALRIDSKAKQLVTEAGPIDYDYLIIATGSKTNYFGNKVIEEKSMPLKSVSDALNLRSLILENCEASLLTSDLVEREQLMNYVIVGGGPTGVELSGALAELKKHVLPKDYPDLDLRRMNVHLVEATNTLLGTMNPKAGEKAKEYLTEMGVNVWLNTKVEDFDGSVVKTNSKQLPSKTLIWAAGVSGNIIDGINSESIERGRILVNKFNEVEGYDDIYCIGDVCLMKSDENPDGDPMVAQTAIQQGNLLAKNLNGLAKGEDMKPFVYSDKGSMATIGRNKAVAEVGKLFFDGILAWLVWMFVHLMALVGFRNRVVALINWVQNYITYDKGIRLIIRPFKNREEN
ncbi:MAG TPA: FAD-dependent oxidoreductase [Balneola sp.]|jgi:NADH dehydrogenase|nr:FAD-dependent oxidoreductase [Balneola sp.]MAO76247.1 FAD-dependent oxidoreductase [Balneola sp.]MBF63902.1 FAD-dependent oxidoreductase [Balneola sp.]HAH51534.1 FAD-dependent oxidoreductase [Balneola sp.]HAW79667.1 FAD-dependent oxidoreductase [Balneola sp.]|tara:strand:- start:12421 stop:13704 length:1284 start_codon:yes stop_codon:yes gene_type:complete